MSGGRGFLNNRNNQRCYSNHNNNNNSRGQGFRRNNTYNNNNSNSRNDLPKEALPPLTYKAKPDRRNRTKIEWTYGNARTESEEVAVYDDTAKEDYLRTLAEYREILIDYPYLQSDNEATTACRIFKKCLKGSAKNSYSRAVAKINGGVIDTNSALENVIEETTNSILGLNAHSNQIEYLKTTKKPKNLSVDEWMRRIQNINLHLANMENGARLLTDRELIKEVIIPNIPIRIKYQLKIQGGSTLTWDRVNEILTNMFALTNWEQNKRNGNHNNNRWRRRNNHGNGRGRGYNNNDSNYYNKKNKKKNSNRYDRNRREEGYQ